ncbi:MAG: hypothetical protein B1H04_02890 [Planctomycetales bacterium 4484_123]|nr:MAG: hypothetical protein B1H04_02890 [Planctomycetales bacterium 4484_123]
MNWKLPNQLTVARLVLAGVFFVLLAAYDPPAPGGARGNGPLVLNICFVLYIVAGITDVLDGYLARRWKITSAFGRVVDPFVDKVLVVGAFAMLAGNNYVLVEGFHGQWELSLPHWLTGHMASGVQAWMVVAVMAREFVVSAVRGYSESQGQKFPATVWGKLKMLTQSVAICTVIYQMANVPHARWAVVTKLVVVWLGVVVSVASGFAYVSRARKLLASGD